MKGNSERTSGKSLSPLWAQNNDLRAASQKFLTEAVSASIENFDSKET